MRETMCKEELKEFNAIQDARNKNMQNFKDGLLTEEAFKQSCVDLIEQLDNLKTKYDEIYAKQSKTKAKLDI